MPDRAPMTVHGPEDLIATIPHLLGFHPRESVVLVWIRQETIALTQRFDLADMPRSQQDTVELLTPGLRISASEVVVVVYTGASIERDPMALVPVANDLGIEVVDVLVTHDDRWWSVLCAEQCCPPQGRVIDAQVRQRVATAFVVDGVVVHADRAELVAEVAADPQLISSTQAAITRLPIRNPDALLADCLSQWQRVTRQEQRRLRAKTFATHIVALRNIPARDLLGWHLAGLERDPLRATSWLLRSVLRGAPPGDVAPIGTMAGIASWLTGDGARAQVCLERALADDPDYRLGRLIARSLQCGLPPGDWRTLVRSIPLGALSASIVYSPALGQECQREAPAS